MKVDKNVSRYGNKDIKVILIQTIFVTLCQLLKWFCMLRKFARKICCGVTYNNNNFTVTCNLKQKAPSKEQKITSNEQKVTSNEEKVTSNEQRAKSSASCESNIITVYQEHFSSENTYAFWYCCQSTTIKYQLIE